jgi:hypothetical protein
MKGLLRQVTFRAGHLIKEDKDGYRTGRAV